MSLVGTGLSESQKRAKERTNIIDNCNSRTSILLKMTWTLLHEACEHLDVKSIYDRCRMGSNEPLEHDDHGSTPLHILAWGNPDPNLLQTLVSSCPAAVSDKDVHGDTCLHVACSYPGTAVQVVKVLLDACPNLSSTTNIEGLMPLHVACRFAPQNEAVIRYLIDVYPWALRSRIKANKNIT
jgi:ankyrin repeat protein